MQSSRQIRCSIGKKQSYHFGAFRSKNFFLNFDLNFKLFLFLNQKHYYQPMFTLVGGGMKSLSDTWRPMADCIFGSAKWLQDAAGKFEPQSNTVITEKGDTIEYEFMIIAVGLKLNYDKVYFATKNSADDDNRVFFQFQIPGLVEALKEPKGPVCSNYSPLYVDRTLAAFEAFKGGNAIFTFPNTPIKCPGAPQKIAYIFDDFLRKRGKRESAKITYNTSLPVLFSVKDYADALWKICKERQINVNLRTNLVEIYPEKRQALFENLDDSTKKEVVDVSEV